MNKLYMLVGLPGSGKSMHAQKLIDEMTILLSSDVIRGELFGDESVQSNPELVFATLHKRAKEAFAEGKSVIYDATNISSKRRMAFLREIKRFNVETHAIVFATPINTCIDNDLKRERKVGANVIEKMWKTFQTPHSFEGWDNIEVIKSISIDDGIENLTKLGEICNSFEQFNEHHTLTVGGHMEKALIYAEERTNDETLLFAVGLHDIGKPYTFSFKNRKGKYLPESHFYNHECVGAYEILTNLADVERKDELLDMVAYVTYHMEMHSFTNAEWTPEKRERKLRDKFGDKIYEGLKLLNEADMMAH